LKARTPKKWSKYDQIEKARLAEAFKSELVQEFLDYNVDDLYFKWVKEGDSEKREQLWLQCQGIEAFRKFIEDTIVLGKMAQAEVNAAKSNEGESNR
jgi:hypothetical protein